MADLSHRAWIINSGRAWQFLLRLVLDEPLGVSEARGGVADVRRPLELMVLVPLFSVFELGVCVAHECALASPVLVALSLHLLLTSSLSSHSLYLRG